MLLKILGMFDIISAAILFLLKYGVWEWVAWVCVVYIVAKSVFCIKSMASIGDLAAAGLFVAAIFGYYNILTYIAVLWLLQKGIVSFL